VPSDVNEAAARALLPKDQGHGKPPSVREKTSEVDSEALHAEIRRVKRWLSLLFVAAALLALLGQEAALAQVGPATQAEHVVAASQMDSACAEMMAHAKQSEPAKPCQGMTFDCIAKMGCSTTAALLPDRVLDASTPFHSIVPYSRPATALHGRTVGPEPDPPTILG
jgi:hypothetical protein